MHKIPFLLPQNVSQCLHHTMIFLAIIGFWWSYRIFVQKTADHLTAVDEEEEDNIQVKKEEDHILLDEDGIYTGLMEIMLHWMKSSLNHFNSGFTALALVLFQIMV